MKVKILPNIILMFSIILISLFSPEGLVLFSIGNFSITEGAILSGIKRSSILIGLLYLSKNISLSNIKLSGTVGIIIRDTFHYFNQLTSGDKIKFKGFMEQIDNKLLKLTPYNNETVNSTSKKSYRYNYIGVIITAIIFSLDKIAYSF